MVNKTLSGIVTSIKMSGSAVVTVTRKTAHPLYKKLIKKSKNFIIDTKGQTVVEGQAVVIVETRKMAGKKHFALKGDNAK